MVSDGGVSVFPFTATHLYMSGQRPRMIEELSEAAAVATASEACGDEDARERLDGLESQLSRLAESEQGADHGRLARIQRALDELEMAVESEATVPLDQRGERGVGRERVVWGTHSRTTASDG